MKHNLVRSSNANPQIRAIEEAAWKVASTFFTTPRVAVAVLPPISDEFSGGGSTQGTARRAPPGGGAGEAREVFGDAKNVRKREVPDAGGRGGDLRSGV